MCVIILKPRGRRLPDDDLLRKAFNHNHDGFGWAYHREGTNEVVIQKGAMDFESARHIIRELRDPKACNIMMHFRLATEGKVCPENCHPYPISRKRAELKATEFVAHNALAHNGIITHAGATIGIKLQEDLTDTQKFIKYYLTKLGLSIYNEGVLKLISNYVGGRFGLLTPQGQITMGDFTEKAGLWYSNQTFMTTTYLQSYCESQQPPRFSYCDGCGAWEYLEEFLVGWWLCESCHKVLNGDVTNTIWQGRPPLWQGGVATQECLAWHGYNGE